MTDIHILCDKFKEIRGFVERIGPYFGNGTSQGIIFLLKGDPTIYIVLRYMGESNGLMGLTMVGDELYMKVDSHERDTKFVFHTNIQNLTLNSRLRKNGQNF